MPICRPHELAELLNVARHDLSHSPTQGLTRRTSPPLDAQQPVAGAEQLHRADRAARAPPKLDGGARGELDPDELEGVPRLARVLLPARAAVNGDRHQLASFGARSAAQSHASAAHSKR